MFLHNTDLKQMMAIAQMADQLQFPQYGRPNLAKKRVPSKGRLQP